MRLRKGTSFIVALMVVVLFGNAAVAGPVPGTNRPKMPDEQVLFQRYSPMQIQQFRKYLINIFNDQMEIQSMLGHPVSEETAARPTALPFQLRDVEIARWLTQGAGLKPMKAVANKALMKTVKMVGVSPNTTSNLSRTNTKTLSSRMTIAIKTLS